jgi:hypothetical protein
LKHVFEVVRAAACQLAPRSIFCTFRRVASARSRCVFSACRLSKAPSQVRRSLGDLTRS